MQKGLSLRITLYFIGLLYMFYRYQSLMIKKLFLLSLMTLLGILSFSATVSAADSLQQRIAIVSSYHPEYKWSQGTNKGLMQGLLEFGYLDNQEQQQEFLSNNRVTTSRAEIRKYWMDTKHRKSQKEIAATLADVSAKIEAFAPDILLLGDDNAANYVGNYFLDTDLPVVFWGVNGTPLKYGLIDSFESPGHNVTGIYQQNYHKENLQLLLNLASGIKRVAILSDDSTTGRSHSKVFQRVINENPQLGIELVDSVSTGSFQAWQNQVLALAPNVDAFLLASMFTLKNEEGEIVDPVKLMGWYLKNISKPEIVAQINLVRDGMLATVFDSPEKQGYETAKILRQVLSQGKKPADITPYAPEHGGYVINRWRANALGLTELINKQPDLLHEIIDDHVNLD